MREIKFRAKTIAGTWVYGLLTHDEGKKDENTSSWFISNKSGKPYAFSVRPETIDQFTGLFDKNDKEIYEGDIVRIYPEGDLREIIYDLERASYVADERNSGHDELSPLLWNEKVEVIGNIYENSELLS